jgi:superfamily II DNA or RNA helicase
MSRPERARTMLGSGPPLPPSFAGVYSASIFFARLALYLGRAIEHSVERYSPLAAWWNANDSTATLRSHVLELAPEIDATLDTLRAWQPPRLPAEAPEGVRDLYDGLVRVYTERAADARIGYGPPGPLDARHPGFELSYFAKRRVLEVRERSSSLLTDARHLAILIGLDQPGRPFTFEGSAFAPYGAVEAWDLFALHAMITALHSRKSDAVRELERDLARPPWEHVLDRLAGRKPIEEREWSFRVAPVGGTTYVVASFARPVSSSSKAGRWKRERFEALFDEEVLPVEREIARLVLVGDRGGRRGTFVLGTPHAHELLCRLAGHPRVFLDRGRDEGETGPALEINAGLLSMTLDRARGGKMQPRFFVDGSPLPSPLGELSGDRQSAFRAAVSPRGIVSIEVPKLLRPWLDMALEASAALEFPAEATRKLVSAMQPLIAKGLVEVPRAALGTELASEPMAALRVEWLSSEEGVAAIIEVMIQPCPGAPFVATGRGPALFPFERDGASVFVERDVRAEIEIAGDALDRIDVELFWVEGVGRTEDLRTAIALAAWLDRNPLGLPIEVKVGRAPVVRALDGSQGKLVVRKIGAWLRIDGALELGGAKVSFGEVLEAARHARRYVRLDDGSFGLLSKEVETKLAPVAVAAALVPSTVTKVDSNVAVHAAFGSVLARLAEALGEVSVEGADLDKALRQLEARSARERVPAIQNGTLRDYQHAGVEWMLALARWAPGCVLADDMGLGKTVQTSAVLQARSKLGPALVIAPASVCSNWVAELARFVPRLRVVWYNEERPSLAELGPRDVVVVSYQLLQRTSDAFGERAWSTVVIDEAQYVKNVLAQRRDAIRSLSRDFTIALTGTPLENHLGELFSIVDLTFPGLLGDEATFRDCFRRPIEAHRDGERLALLGSLLGPFFLRRTRDSVLQELPPRQEITEYVELSMAERKRYLALRKACEESMRQHANAETPAQLRIALLAALTRLRQMACDVRLVEPSFAQPSAKIARVVELTRLLADEGNRALVFSQFTQFLEKVRPALEEAGLRVAMLTGETPTKSRRALIDAFQAGEFDVFCVSLLAGGTGLNLTKATYVIHLDPWWNPAVEEQATSRVHRIGQVHPVTVYRLVARGTIEEAVLEMHADKRELASAVLEGKGSPKAISSKELFELLRFGGV